MSLPAELAAALKALSAEAGTGLRHSAETISSHYRARGQSRQVVAGADDALAYALTRMPATYAAMARVLDELEARAPDFVPATQLDVGAGPGTAAWAAAEVYPGIETVMVDHSSRFRDLAQQLGTPGEYRIGDLGAAGETRHELVTCGYALTELEDRRAVAVVEALWAQCDGALVLVEPGRPRDYERLMVVRDALIAAGGVVLAPCPHELACPLVTPDWCHFAVRLERSREHKRLKGGALGYEDEKFSYLVVARPGIGTKAAARVIRPVRESKPGIELDLCTAAGDVVTQSIAARDKPAIKRARKLRWGDAVAAE